MRNISVFLACVVLLSLVGGCASTGRFPIDPKDQALWYVDKAEQQAQNGNFERVSFMLAEAAGRPGGVEAAKDMLSKSPNIKAKLSEYFQQTASRTTNKEELNNLAKYASTLGKSGIIQDSEKIANAIDVRATQGNASGEIRWLLSDDISYLPALRSLDTQKMIFERTLEAMTDRNKPYSMTKALAEYLSKGERTSSEMQIAKLRLSKITLRRAELQEFERIFPDLVKEQLGKLTAYIQVTVSPADRLLEEDIKEKLKYISSNYVVLKSGEQGNANMIKVAIEKLRSEERQLPTQSQTVTYAQYDVNLLAAALLMPRNASYMYEWSIGGVELEYGYVVRVLQDDHVMLDELMRGTLTERFVSCNNPRIVNVFGGTTRADFVANNDMVSRCSGATNSPPSIQDLKSRVLKLLVDKVVSVEPLATRRE